MRPSLPAAVLLLAATSGSAAPGPDLAAGGLTLVGGTPGAGEPVSLELVVRNAGVDPAGPFRVKALLSPTLPVTARDAEIGSTEVTTLPGGGEITVALDGFIPAASAPGRYRLGAFIDPENAVLDVVRSNNGAATANFTVTRPPGSMEAGDAVDLGLGPLGKDGMDLFLPEGAEAFLRVRGVRGVRPSLSVLAPGPGAVLATDSGGSSATVRWTAPADGVYRVQMANAAETVGRARLTTRASVRVRGLPAVAPAEIPFAAFEDGTVKVSALYEGEAAPLLFRFPPAPDSGSPGTVKGRRARLGPLAPLDTGGAALVLGGAGEVRVDIDSRTTTRGALHVR